MNQAIMDMIQDKFDLTIGRLDRVLSLVVNYGRNKTSLDEANKQTLKHHAEDMIAAGQKILKDLGEDQVGLPQPEFEGDNSEL